MESKATLALKKFYYTIEPDKFLDCSKCNAVIDQSRYQRCPLCNGRLKRNKA